MHQCQYYLIQLRFSMKICQVIREARTVRNTRMRRDSPIRLRRALLMILLNKSGLAQK